MLKGNNILYLIRRKMKLVVFKGYSKILNRFVELNHSKASRTSISKDLQHKWLLRSVTTRQTKTNRKQYISHYGNNETYGNMLQKKGKNQLPGTSSITIYIGCRWVQTPISFTILGWSYCLSILQNTQEVYYSNELIVQAD